MEPFLTLFRLLDASETSEFLIVFGRTRYKDEESDAEGRNKRMETRQQRMEMSLISKYPHPPFSSFSCSARVEVCVCVCV